MSVCGNYAKHYWTHSLRPKDKFCGRCGFPFLEWRKVVVKSPLQQFIPSFSNAKTPRTESRRSSRLA